MKLIPHASLEAVAGGQVIQLIITQKIPADGISPACIQVFNEAASAMRGIYDENELDRLEEKFMAKVEMVCGMKGLTFLDSLDNAPFLTVEYKK